MVSIVTKKINGNEYLYLVHSIRKKNKVIQKTIKYIGKKRPIPKEEFTCMELSYENKDWILNEMCDKLSYTKHEDLKVASNNYKKYFLTLSKTAKEKEEEKFLGKFIANSNALEGSTLTAKETTDFLFNDIVPLHHSKKELYMATNMLEAWNYIKSNYKKFPTHKDLKELHERVNRNIETEDSLGKYKKVQNYIGDIHTTSFLFVEEKMEQLLQWIKDAFRKINDFEVAFQSHAQFEIIHPFIDGNGRVGRILINWILLHKNLQPLAIPIKKKAEYIIALENSRREKVEAISEFCFKSYLEQYSFMN